MRIPIYYPNIAPNKQWILQTILYGDKFSSITPNIQLAYDELEKQLGYTDNNLLLLGGHYIPSLTRDVIVDERLTRRLKRSIGHFHKEGIRERTARQENRPYDLHINKANDEMLRWLRKEGMVNFEHGNWVNIDERIGFKYMSLIVEQYAKEHMAQDTENLYIPATDQIAYYRWLTGDHDGMRIRKAAMKIRLRNRLPVPFPNVGLERVLDFRNTNQDALRRLNVRLETSISNIITECENDNDFEDALETIANEIISEVDRLEKNLNNSGIQTYLSSWGQYMAGSEAVSTFCQLFGITAPTLIKVSGGILSVLLGGATDWNRRQAMRQNSDVEYLYLARQYAARHRTVTLY